MSDFLGLFTACDTAEDSPKYFRYSTDFSGYQLLYIACYNLGISYNSNYILRFKDKNDNTKTVDMDKTIKEQNIEEGTIVYIRFKTDTKNVPGYRMTLRNCEYENLFSTKLVFTVNRNKLETEEYLDFNINENCDKDENYDETYEIFVFNQNQTVSDGMIKIHRNETYECILAKAIETINLPNNEIFTMLFEKSGGERGFYNQLLINMAFRDMEFTKLRVFPKRITIQIKYPYVRNLKYAIDLSASVISVVEELSKILNIMEYHDFSIGYENENGNICYFKRDKAIILQIKQIPSELILNRRYFNFTREGIADMFTSLQAMNDAKIQLLQKTTWPTEDQVIDLIYYSWIVFTEGAPLKDLFSTPSDLLPGKYAIPKNVIQKTQKQYANAAPIDRNNAIRLWLRTIRQVSGFGAEQYFGYLILDEMGVPVEGEMRIVATPLSIIIAHPGNVNSQSKGKGIISAIPYLLIRNIDETDDGLITIEYTKRSMSSVFIQLRISRGRGNDFFTYISENNQIIRDIMSDRAKRRASGEVVMFSASLDRIILKTSFKIDDKAGKEFIYDRSLTMKQFIQAALRNNGVNKDPSDYKVLLKQPSNNMTWVETGILGALNISDHTQVFVINPVVKTKIKFSNGSTKIIMIDHSKPVSEIVKEIFKRSGMKYIPGYTLYSYDNKPLIPLDGTKCTIGQSRRLDKFLFRRCFFILSDQLLENRVTRIQTIDDCYHYIRKQETSVTLDQAIDLAVLCQYAKADDPHSVRNADISNVSLDLPKKFKVDERIRRMYAEKLSTSPLISSVNACRKFFSAVRNINGFGSETFKIKFSLGSSSTGNFDGNLVIHPMFIELKDNKKEIVKISWKRISKIQTTKTTIIINFSRNQKESMISIISQEIDSINNIINGHMQLISEMNRYRKESERELPIEEQKRISGEFIDEDGIRQPKQIDMYIGLDPTKATDLDKIWFNLNSRRSDVLKLAAEPLGISNYEDYEPLIIIMKEGKWLTDQEALEEIKPHRRSYAILIKKEITINYQFERKTKSLTFNCKMLVTQVIEKIAENEGINDPEKYALFYCKQDETYTPLICNKTVAEQISSHREQFKIIPRVYSVPEIDLNDDAKLLSTYQQARDIFMFQANRSIPLHTTFILSTLAHTISIGHKITKSDIPSNPATLLPNGFDSNNCNMNEFVLTMGTYSYQNEKKVMQDFIMLLGGLSSFGTYQVSAIQIKNYDSKLEGMNDDINIIVDPEKVYIISKINSSPILEIRLNSIIDWKMTKDLWLKGKRQFIATIKYANAYGKTESFSYHSKECSFIHESIEFFRKLAKDNLLKSRPNISTPIIQSSDFNLSIPTVYVDGKTSIIALLDKRMIPSEIIKKTSNGLHLYNHSSYCLMLELSEDERRWLKDDEMIGTLSIPPTARLLVYDSRSTFSITYKRKETHQIKLNVTDPIWIQMKQIMIEFESIHWLGCTLYHKPKYVSVSIPLDPQKSILEQTYNIKVLSIRRLFYIVTKYDIKDQQFAVKLFVDIKHHFLSGVPIVSKELIVELALYQLIINCRGRHEYEEMKLDSFSPYLPKSVEDNPIYIQILQKLKSENQYTPKGVAALKYIQRLVNNSKRFGCTSFDALFINRMNENKPENSDPVKLYIGYPMCSVYNTNGVFYTEFKIDNIIRYDSHSEILIINVIDQSKNLQNLVFYTPYTSQIVMMIKASKELINPLITKRCQIQEKIKHWADTNPEDNQFDINASSGFSQRDCIRVRINIGDSLFCIISSILKILYYTKQDASKYCAVLVNRGKENKYTLLNEDNVQNSLPPTGKHPCIVVSPIDLLADICLPNGQIFEATYSLTETVNSICFRIMKDAQIGFHEGYTLYYKDKDNKIHALNTFKPIFEQINKTDMFILKRLAFTFSRSAVFDLPTMISFYRDCKEQFLNGNFKFNDGVSAELANLSFMIEYPLDGVERPAFDPILFSECAPQESLKNTIYLSEVRRHYENDLVLEPHKASCKFIWICCQNKNFGIEKFDGMIIINDNPAYHETITLSPFSITYGGVGYSDGKIEYQDINEYPCENGTITFITEEMRVTFSSESIDEISNYVGLIMALLKRGSFFLNQDSMMAALEYFYTPQESSANRSSADYEEEEYEEAFEELDSSIIQINPEIINFDHMDIALDKSIITIAPTLKNIYATQFGNQQADMYNVSSFELVEETSINPSEVLPMISINGLNLIHSSNITSLLLAALSQFIDSQYYTNPTVSVIEYIRSFTEDSISDDQNSTIKEKLLLISKNLNNIDRKTSMDDMQKAISNCITITNEMRTVLGDEIVRHMEMIQSQPNTIDFNSFPGKTIAAIVNIVTIAERLNFLMNVNFTFLLSKGFSLAKYSPDILSHNTILISGIIQYIEESFDPQVLMSMILPELEKFESLALSIKNSISECSMTNNIDVQPVNECSDMIIYIVESFSIVNQTIIETSKDSMNLFNRYYGNVRSVKDFSTLMKKVYKSVLNLVQQNEQTQRNKFFHAMLDYQYSTTSSTLHKEKALQEFTDQYFTNCLAAANKFYQLSYIAFKEVAGNRFSESISFLEKDFQSLSFLLFSISAIHIRPANVKQLQDTIKQLIEELTNINSDENECDQLNDFIDCLKNYFEQISDHCFAIARNPCSGQYVQKAQNIILEFYQFFLTDVNVVIETIDNSDLYEMIQLYYEKINFLINNIFIEPSIPCQIENYQLVIVFHDLYDNLASLINEMFEIAYNNSSNDLIYQKANDEKNILIDFYLRLCCIRDLLHWSPTSASFLNDIKEIAQSILDSLKNINFLLNSNEIDMRMIQNCNKIESEIIANVSSIQEITIPLFRMPPEKEVVQSVINILKELLIRLESEVNSDIIMSRFVYQESLNDEIASVQNYISILLKEEINSTVNFFEQLHQIQNYISTINTRMPCTEFVNDYSEYFDRIVKKLNNYDIHSVSTIDYARKSIHDLMPYVNELFQELVFTKESGAKEAFIDECIEVIMYLKNILINSRELEFTIIEATSYREVLSHAFFTINKYIMFFESYSEALSNKAYRAAPVMYETISAISSLSFYSIKKLSSPEIITSLSLESTLAEGLNIISIQISELDRIIENAVTNNYTKEEHCFKSIKELFQIIHPMVKLLCNEEPFAFYKECYTKLTEKTSIALIVLPLTKVENLEKLYVELCHNLLLMCYRLESPHIEEATLNDFLSKLEPLMQKVSFLSTSSKLSAQIEINCIKSFYDKIRETDDIEKIQEHCNGIYKHTARALQMYVDDATNIKAQDLLSSLFNLVSQYATAQIITISYTRELQDRKPSILDDFNLMYVNSHDLINNALNFISSNFNQYPVFVQKTLQYIPDEITNNQCLLYTVYRLIALCTSNKVESLEKVAVQQLGDLTSIIQMMSNSLIFIENAIINNTSLDKINEDISDLQNALMIPDVNVLMNNKRMVSIIPILPQLVAIKKPLMQMLDDLYGVNDTIYNSMEITVASFAHSLQAFLLTIYNCYIAYYDKLLVSLERTRSEIPEVKGFIQQVGLLLIRADRLTKIDLKLVVRIETEFKSFVKSGFELLMKTNKNQQILSGISDIIQTISEIITSMRGLRDLEAPKTLKLTYASIFQDSVILKSILCQTILTDTHIIPITMSSFYGVISNIEQTMLLAKSQEFAIVSDVEKLIIEIKEIVSNVIDRKVYLDSQLKSNMLQLIDQLINKSKDGANRRENKLTRTFSRRSSGSMGAKKRTSISELSEMIISISGDLKYDLNLEPTDNLKQQIHRSFLYAYAPSLSSNEQYQFDQIKSNVIVAKCLENEKTIYGEWCKLLNVQRMHYVIITLNLSGADQTKGYFSDSTVDEAIKMANKHLNNNLEENDVYDNSIKAIEHTLLVRESIKLGQSKVNASAFNSEIASSLVLFTSQIRELTIEDDYQEKKFSELIYSSHQMALLITGIMMTIQHLQLILTKLIVNDKKLQKIISSHKYKLKASQEELVKGQATLFQLFTLTQSPEVIDVITSDVSENEKIVIISLIFDMLNDILSHDIADVTNDSYVFEVESIFSILSIKQQIRISQMNTGTIEPNQLFDKMMNRTYQLLIESILIERLSTIAISIHIPSKPQSIKFDKDVFKENFSLVSKIISYGLPESDLSALEALICVRSISAILSACMSKDVRIKLRKIISPALQSYFITDNKTISSFLLNKLNESPSLLDSMREIPPARISDSYFAFESRLLEMTRNLASSITSFVIQQEHHDETLRPQSILETRKGLCNIIPYASCSYEEFKEVISNMGQHRRSEVIGLHIMEQLANDQVEQQSKIQRCGIAAVLNDLAHGEAQPLVPGKLEQLRSKVIEDDIRIQITLRLRKLQMQRWLIFGNEEVPELPRSYSLNQEILIVQKDLISQIMKKNPSISTSNFALGQLFLEYLIEKSINFEFQNVTSEEDGIALILSSLDTDQIIKESLLSPFEIERKLIADEENLHYIKLKKEFVNFGAIIQLISPRTTDDSDTTPIDALMIAGSLLKCISLSQDISDIQTYYKDIPYSVIIKTIRIIIDIIQNFAPTEESFTEVKINIPYLKEAIISMTSKTTIPTVISKELSCTQLSLNVIPSLTTIPLKECREIIAFECNLIIGYLKEIIIARGALNSKLTIALSDHSTIPLILLSRLQKEDDVLGGKLEAFRIKEMIVNIMNLVKLSVDTTDTNKSIKFRNEIYNILVEFQRIQNIVDQTKEEPNLYPYLIRLYDEINKNKEERIMISILEITQLIDHQRSKGFSISNEVDELYKKLERVRPVVVGAFTSYNNISEKNKPAILSVQNSAADVIYSISPSYFNLVDHIPLKDEIIEVIEKTKISINEIIPDLKKLGLEKRQKLIYKIIEFAAFAISSSSKLFSLSVADNIQCIVESSKVTNEIIDIIIDILENESLYSIDKIIKRIRMIYNLIDCLLCICMDDEPVLKNTILESVQLSSLRAISAVSKSIAATIATRANCSIDSVFIKIVGNSAFSIESFNDISSLLFAQLQNDVSLKEVNHYLGNLIKYGKLFNLHVRKGSKMFELLKISKQAFQSIHMVMKKISTLKNDTPITISPNIHLCKEIPFHLEPIENAEGTDLQASVNSLNEAFMMLIPRKAYFVQSMNQEPSKINNSLIELHACLSCFVTEAARLAMSVYSLKTQLLIEGYIRQIQTDFNTCIEQTRFWFATNTKPDFKELERLDENINYIFALAAESLVSKKETDQIEIVNIYREAIQIRNSMRISKVETENLPSNYLNYSHIQALEISIRFVDITIEIMKEYVNDPIYKTKEFIKSSLVAIKRFPDVKSLLAHVRVIGSKLSGVPQKHLPGLNCTIKAASVLIRKSSSNPSKKDVINMRLRRRLGLEAGVVRSKAILERSIKALNESE